jgi:hypothetical protein
MKFLKVLKFYENFEFKKKIKKKFTSDIYINYVNKPEAPRSL